MDCFGIPFLDSSWYGIHGHDSSHERGGDSSGEVSNEDVWVFDIGLGNMVLEFWDVLIQGRGIGLVLLKDHPFGGEPGNGGFSYISLFEVFIELGDEIWVSS